MTKLEEGKLKDRVVELMKRNGVAAFAIDTTNPLDMIESAIKETDSGRGFCMRDKGEIIDMMREHKIVVVIAAGSGVNFGVMQKETQK